MKCENCGHLRTEGYEYPETYCELGIADTGDGCTVPKKKRIEICKELKESKHFFGLWWDESKEN